MWSALAVFLLISSLQIFLALTGKVIPNLVSLFYKGSIAVFFISVLWFLHQKN